MKRGWIAWLGVAGLTLASPAFGFPIGNPIPRVDAGETVIELSGAAGSRDLHPEGARNDQTFQIGRESVALALALADHRLLGLLMGALTIDPGPGGQGASSGSEWGVFYRHGVRTEGPFKHGFVVMYRYGATERRDSTVTLEQYTAAYGVSVPLSERTTAYGAGLYQHVAGSFESKPAGTRIDLDSRGDLGAYGGVEVHLTHATWVGLEVQGGTETGGAAYFQMRL